MRIPCAVLAGGLAFAFVMAAVPASADTVLTTSNQTFTGKILEDTPEKIVVKTDSGTVTIPRIAVSWLQKDAAAEAPKIVPSKIFPAEAPQAFEKAKAAVAAGEWVRAGCLLAGLMDLPPGAFPQENRLTASAALATCYLQTKDARGAAKTFTQRAGLVLNEGDKRRLLATAEALEKAADKVGLMMGIVIEGRPVSTYEEAIGAAMLWKAARLLEEARDAGAKAAGLNEADKLDAAAKRIVDKLNEGDLYAPGFSVMHRKAALGALVENIMTGAQKAIQMCGEDRKVLSRFWQTSAADAKTAIVYNQRVTAYLARRQAAEDAVKGLQAFATKYQAPELYAERAEALGPLLAQLEELRYHTMMPGMPHQLMITPRRIGSQFN
jgi:hypothetical protein